MAKWFNKYFKDPAREPVIVDYVRTPMGSKKGTLKRLRGDDMLVHVLETVYKRNKNIDWDGLGKLGLADVICGCNSQIGACALDVGKCAELAAGMPMSIPGVTLNRQCASGQQTTIFGYQEIASGDKDLVITCGVESQNVYPIMSDMNVADGNPLGGNLTVAPNPKMNNNPFIQESYKKYAKYEPDMQGQIYAAEVMGRLWREKSGKTPEAFRQELDELSVWSHEKAGKHYAERNKEIEPITVPKVDEKGMPILLGNGMLDPANTEVTSQDEGIRPTKGMLEKLKTLDGIVKRKSGILTAGNSCPTSDGAACLVWTSKKYAQEHGLKIKGTLEAFVTVGTDTPLMLTGPIEAAPLALKRAELKMDDMSVIEINEAFSTVVQASCFELGLSWKDERLNPLGGAIALGHPTGMTGIRLTGTILNQLEAKNKQFGLATLCVGFGMGIGTVIRRGD
jgi:acetyl-CoA acetyltransferase family protein